MDIGTLRGLGTVVIMVAFIGLVIWAYSGKRKKSFDEATMLPFADEYVGGNPRSKNREEGEEGGRRVREIRETWYK
ncbi:cbb3-type cytochrome oxidase subunit 3, partial [Pseudomonas aeruginosa]|uniref:cbb3-type cytochrome oxidase subunit 3 n=1 Tax=Pseudomonas aeruginosa TaxID=287 RepID=UPI0039822F7B